MASMKDDDAETLDFADESEYMEDAGAKLTADIADMIADAFGRSVIDADRQLAEAIIRRIGFTADDDL